MDENTTGIEGFYTDEALGGDYIEPTTEVATEAPAESVETQPSPAEPVQEQQPDYNPEGPGNVREALRQAREAERMAREQLAQYQAYVQQLQQPQPQQETEFLDEALAQHTQSQLTEMRAQFEQQTQAMRIEMAETMARQQFPDYDEVIGRLAEMDAVNVAAFLNKPNPALAAYQFAKQYTPQAIEAEVQRRVSEIAKTLTPQTPKAPKTIGNLPAAAPNVDKAADLSAVPVGHLAQMTPENRESWYEQALRQA